MVYFYPPYSFRRLGQTDATQTPAGPAVPVSTPPSAPAAVLAPAQAPVTSYDQKSPITMAGLLVGGVVLAGLTLTVSASLLRRD